MEAAAAGKSSIGIPQKVGKEYAKADRAKARRKETKSRGRKRRR